VFTLICDPAVEETIIVPLPDPVVFDGDALTTAFLEKSIDPMASGAAGCVAASSEKPAVDRFRGAVFVATLNGAVVGPSTSCLLAAGRGAVKVATIPGAQGCGYVGLAEIAQ
jgi:hypothetical protein